MKKFLVTMMLLGSLLGVTGCEKSKDFDSWKEAYKEIVINSDKYVKAISDAEDCGASDNDCFYLGIHDFDFNGIPEFIIADGLSAAVYTYQDGIIKQIADICANEHTWGEWGINGGNYKDNCLYFQCDGSDGSCYVCWTYRDGGYITGVYDDYKPDICILNGVEVTYEEFNNVFFMEDMKDYKNDGIGYYQFYENTNTFKVLISNTNELNVGDCISVESVLSKDLDLGNSNYAKAPINIIVKRDDIILKCDDTNTGVVTDLKNLAWMSLRDNEILSCGTILETDNEYILESNLALNSKEDLLDSSLTGYWIRVENSVDMPEEGTTVTGHKDYMIYVEGEETYLAVQSYNVLEQWDLYKLPEYANWLKKEVDIILRMYTGL